MLETFSIAYILFKFGACLFLILSVVIFIKGYFTLKVSSGVCKVEAQGKEMMKSGAIFFLISLFAVFLLSIK